MPDETKAASTATRATTRKRRARKGARTRNATTSKPEGSATSGGAREFMRQLATAVTRYNAEEGMGPHEPITADTLYHAAQFIDGKPPKASKTAATE